VRIGIDLGGTKIEAIALDGDGRERFRKRVETPAGDYGATVDAVAGLVADAEVGVGPSSVGIATPGARSLVTGRMKNANSTWLNDRPLKEDLEARLAREIRMENDANCFALSEAIDGAGRGARVVFGVILGTGVGGGVVIDGSVIRGANAIAGEWGHNPLPLPTSADQPLPLCYCGRRGCIETYLSGPALANDRAAGVPFERYEERLARALAGVVNVLDPDVIVLGGGLSNIASLYERVPKLWHASIFSDEIRTRLARPTHGDASGVRGAAWLWEKR
jgi:fructokinase